MNTLISVDELRGLRQSGAPLVLIDCRFDLADPAAGERAWQAGRVPGAAYAHLDRDLSGPKHDAAGRFQGRHPLPEREVFAATAGRFGITPRTQVVAYDAQGGPYAARAWWLLRWLGHAAVAVLDGGLPAWQAAGGDTDARTPAPAPAAPYPAGEATLPTIDAATLLGGLGQMRLLDARAGERFRGEVEPLDTCAGHIPGARHRFFQHNLQPDGRFKTREQLRAEFEPLLAGYGAEAVVQQCGSGVTACHNLLAMAHAGLGDSVLYPGSWSEWSSDPSRPVARG